MQRMAFNRNRSAAGQSYINMLSERYRDPDPGHFGAGPGRKPGGFDPAAGKRQTYRTEEVSYSFSQEEEMRQDGRTLYKAREERSFNGELTVFCF